MSNPDYSSDYFEKRVSSRNFMSYKDDVSFLCKYLRTPNTILDYGCGEMLFTPHLKLLCPNIFVYDVSDYIQKQYLADKVFCPDTSHQKYDVIVLRGVLQHLDRPFSTIDYLVKNKLNPHGFLAF